jgi:hypothetical protein
MKNLRFGHLQRWLLFLVVSSVVLRFAYASGPSLTQINDVLFRADGTRAGGTLVISWPAFATSDKQPIAAGTKSVRLGADGTVAISLVPTANSTPAGTVYKIVAKFDDGTSSTEYWSVPAAPTAMIASMRVAPSVASQSVVAQAQLAGKLDRVGDSPVSLAGERYASGFGGATATAKLDAAIQDCAGSPCEVVAPSTLPAGDPTVIPDNVALLDKRQTPTMSEWGLPDYGTHTGAMWRRQITSTRNGYDHYTTAHFYLDVEKGGHNSNENGGKNSYWSTGHITVSRTPGQMYGTYFASQNYSSGDTIAQFINVRRYGGTLNYGDEGLEPLRIDVGTGDALFTANVAAVSGNTVTFSGAQNAYTLGETRLVIDRNPAKQHTATGCTVDILGAPNVTCTGATLSSWYGTGTKTNLCFELDSTKVDGKFNRILPVSSITNDTTAALTSMYQGYTGIGWQYAPNTGTGTFSYCSAATDVSTWSANKLTVADASVFAAGDAIEQNIDAAQNLTGISLEYYPSVYPQYRTYALSMTNNGHTNGGSGSPVVPLYGFIHTGGPYNGAPNTVGVLWDHWNGTITGGGINWKNESTTPPGGAWIWMGSENTTGCENMIQTYDSFLRPNVSASSITYCRNQTNSDVSGWRVGPFAITEDARVGMGAGGYGPGGGKQFFIVANGNNDDFYAYQGTANSTGKAYKVANNAWQENWWVDWSGNERHSYGSKQTFYSDSGSTQTAQIDGSSGVAQFAKVCYNSARTLCDYAGTGSPSGSCTTGSTYRRSDGGANSSFYVCEAGNWTAK